MKHAKTIKLFLIDGDPNGRILCELSNWSGKAYKIPRIKVKECIDRGDLLNTAVYMLFGKNDDGDDLVYIGEAESFLKRLHQHLNQKDFWNESIVFISKDENLNKAHVKYLENRLHEFAISAKRYNIENSLIPTRSSLSESERAEMEEYLDNIKLLVNTLGHKIFEEKREIKPIQKQVTFSIKAARGADAKGEPTSDGFVVLKNSKAAASTVSSISPSFLKLRQKLINKGTLKLDGDNYIFTEDYIFNSPSTAAVMVMGRNANGLLEWRLSGGKTLKEFEEL